MKKSILFMLLFAFQLGFTQEVQEKHQRAKIYYSEPQDLENLESLGIPIDHGIYKKGVFVISEFSVSELEKARNAGYTVEVLIEDAKAHFHEQNALNKTPIKNALCNDGTTIEYQTPENFNLGSMGGYFTYQEMLDQLDLMKELYPNLITTKENISNFLTEGQADNSTSPPIGGNGIKWVKISDNPNDSSEGEPQILYTAIHHAREPASLSQLIFYMWYLLENYDDNPEVQSIVNNTELYFVPVINPDGYLYNEKTDPNGGGYWRKNRKNGTGVDPNRNYDYYINGDSNNGMWGGSGASSNPYDETYHGTAPFSEVENQAMKWFVENHNFVMAFNNHTYGNLLLYPFGYTNNAPTPENDLFIGISNELVSKNGFDNILSSELYPAAGDSDDFMYGTVGTHNKIYAFTAEIGTTFWPPSNQIENICKSMMYLNITAAKIVNNFASVNETSSYYTGNQATNNSTFSIKRLGVTGNGNFTVHINPISSNITSVGTPLTFSLDLLEEETGTIQYTVESGTSAGDIISFELVINNGDVNSALVVNKKYGTLTAIFQDEANSVTDNFINNGWNTTNNAYVSPSSSITDSPNGNYPDNANKTITLANQIDLTNASGANVTFYAKWNIEAGYDYTQFEVSIDNGNNWIPQCGKYTKIGSGNEQPMGEPLYDASQNDWVLEEIDLSDYLGETIIARFQFVSDQNVSEDGFYFDDLTFNILDDGALSNNDVLETIFNVYPNPVSDLLHITTPEANYTIEIYNLQGQLVSKPMRFSGSQTFNFSSYTSGIYLMRLTSDIASKTFKIVKK